MFNFAFRPSLVCIVRRARVVSDCKDTLKLIIENFLHSFFSQKNNKLAVSLCCVTLAWVQKL